MADISGSDFNDQLTGTAEADFIQGLKGHDGLLGGAGNDRLEGGEGDDSLNGEEGDDELYGGDGNDVLTEAIGANDRLYGGNGDDWLQLAAYTNFAVPAEALLDGGAGDDLIEHFASFNANRAILLGGDGHDRLGASGGGRIDLDAGADSDLVEITAWEADYRIALGTGSDVMRLFGNEFLFAPAMDLTIADFAAGAGGDSIGIASALARQAEGWDFALNPFATGHLRIVQRGADAVLQADRDGAAGAAFGFGDLILFQNMSAAALTARNLGGWAADGSATAGIDLNGLATPDFVVGTSGNDVLRGLGGKDGLFGAAGDDRLEGGGGDDWLDGELGNDVLLGGDNDDRLDDRIAGSDQLFGEAGNDFLLVERQFFSGAAGTSFMDGGTGADNIEFVGRTEADDATLIGGDGDDDLFVARGRVVTIDAGAGADIVTLNAGVRQAMITLGPDADIMRIGPAEPLPISAFTITDYAAGEDRFDLEAFLGRELTGWNGGNPFASGHLRLAQSGADSLLLVDVSGGSHSFDRLAILSNVAAAQLTAADFGYAPGRVAIAGTMAADGITGSGGDDELIGLAGNDLLNGGAGGDLMQGGAGDDIYFVGQAADRVIERPGEGRDILYSGISFALAAGQEIEVLSTSSNVSGVAINLTGNEFGQTIYGNAGSNVLYGAGGADMLVGLGGDDTYYTDDALAAVIEAAGGGRDVLYTGASYALAAGQEIEVLSTNSHAATAAINLFGNEFSQTIFGNEGANILYGAGGTDILVGFGGDDVYYTDLSATSVLEVSGGGRDALYSGASYVLSATQEIEVLSTNSHASTAAIDLKGNEYSQTIFGNQGNNVIHGGGGNDILAGFGGGDIYHVDSAATSVLEAAGGGEDIVYTGRSYVIASGQEIEVLSTSSYAATLAIDLKGNEGGQRILGNDGANIIDGKGGIDQLIGFGGADRFDFTTAFGPGNVDVVAGFETGSDRIALGHAVFTGLGLGALPAGAFRTGATAADADDRILYNPQTGDLMFDLDGAGGAAAVQFATLPTGLALGAADFLVI